MISASLTYDDGHLLHRYAATAQHSSIFASRFPLAWDYRPRAEKAGGCPFTAWTLVERAGKEWPEGTEVLPLSKAVYAHCTFLDLYRGRAEPLPASDDGSGDTITVQLGIEALGYGAVLAVDAAALKPGSSSHDAALTTLLARQVASSGEIALYLVSRRVLHMAAGTFYIWRRALLCRRRSRSCTPDWAHSTGSTPRDHLGEDRLTLFRHYRHARMTAGTLRISTGTSPRLSVASVPTLALTRTPRCEFGPVERLPLPGCI